MCVCACICFVCASHGDYASLLAWVCLCALFLSAFLFVGWPSHLFQSHICDLLGSDWYGNIIIRARILSLLSPTLSFHFPHSISLISFTTKQISVLCLSLTVSLFLSSSLSSTVKSSPLLRLCSWAQFSQHVLLRSVSSCTQWSIWRDRTLLSPNLIYGEKDSVTHNQLTNVHCRCTKTTASSVVLLKSFRDPIVISRYNLYDRTRMLYLCIWDAFFQWPFHL